MTAEATTVRPARRFDPRWVPLIVTTLGSFMSIMDTQTVNIALPTVLKDFNSSLQNGQLVIASYLIALAVVIPLTGFLAERVGMKRLYIVTVIFFTAGSALCSLAWNVQTLILFRVIQGLGGGMLQPLGMAVVFTMITPLERPKFMALLGIPQLLAPMLGPSVGGYIVEYSSWRVVFLMDVPVGVINIVLAYLLLKETPINLETKLDFRGFAFAAIAFPTILLGLSRGSQQGWGSPLILGLLAIGLTSLALFIRWELRHHDPLMRLSLFKDAMFRLAIVIQWVGIFSLFGLNFLMPLFLQRVHGMGAAAAGRVLLPMGIVSFVALNVAGRLYHRLGPRPIVMAGLGVLALATLGWSRADAHSSTFFLMFLVAARGLGVGLFGQNIQLTAYNTVPEGEMPRATALVNVGQRVAGAFSTAMVTTILVVSLHSLGAPAGSSIAAGTAPADLAVKAFHNAFYIMTVMSLVGMVLAWFLRDRVLDEHKARLARLKEDGGEHDFVESKEESILAGASVRGD